VEHIVVKAKARYWILGLFGVPGLILLATIAPNLAPPLPAKPQGPQITLEHYIRTGQLIADIHTAAEMLDYLFEPEWGPASA
jgi:hypothetical protein